jgi:acyl transferase domain-containing protein/thioesterase domain-containing protein
MEINVQEMKKKSSQTGLEIAVIGIAGKFPGANDINCFWENLKNGVESVTFFSDHQLLEAGVDPGLIRQPNYIKAKGYIEDIQYFDSYFFNYTPNEAEVMDPQVRLFHQCAWHALEDAGYDPDSYKGLIGLYAGYTPNMAWKVGYLYQIGRTSEYLEIENLNSFFFATLICYKLNLKGPGVTVNTACSTSLTAIHMACRALLTGESDMVLSGGVSVTLPGKCGYFYEEGMIMSPDGYCRPFDAKAKGIVPGDGVGVVVLKRLVRAVKDRDHIYAVIKGTAINNDGNRKPGYTAPSVEAQAEVIRAALRMAEVPVQSITYVETHGTATPLGDPIEIEALKKVFMTIDKKRSCCLGFLKANIGHLDAAAGVAGFIKIVLALKYRLIPPAVNFASPNPEIDFENSPFYINKDPEKWSSDEFLLRAGVSSFGIGGTNAHAVLEEFPEGTRGLAPLPTAPFPDRQYQLILLSARTPTALEQMTQNLVHYLQNNRDVPLGNIAYTLANGRKTFEHRGMLVCPGKNEAIAALLSAGPGKIRNYYTEMEDRPVVFMFPGLGTQYVNMGLELYCTEPVFRETMNQCLEILNPLVDYDIKEILYPGISVSKVSEVSGVSGVSGGNMSNKSYTSDINQFEIGQLVIFIFEYALAKLLMSWGIKPQAMIGYSFGEYTAACISNVFSLEDALTLVVTRGRLIRELPAGAMLSVPVNKETLTPLLNDRLAIAIDNGDSCVVAGSALAIDAFEKQIKEKKYLCIRLEASHALHSMMMDPILPGFENQVARLTLNNPTIPFISNVTGKWITPGEAANPRYWAAHLRETVQFSAGVKELMSIENAAFLELGPGVSISTLAYQYIRKESNHTVINLVRPPEQKISDEEYLLGKIGRLWLYGTKIDWPAFYPHGQGKRVPLPPYPFDKLEYPADDPMQKLMSMRQEGEIKLVKQSPPSSPVSTHPGLPKKTPYSPPTNKAEQILAQMWEELLGIRPIGIHDNLLEMGVNSLKGITFVNKLKEQLGEIIHVTSIFDAPTVAELAVYFNKYYPDSFRKLTGEQTSDDTAHPAPGAGVTIEKIMRVRRFLRGSLAPTANETPRNPSAIFILSPPRTGSTLLRVMLAGHPRLFAPPELNLLSFNTLGERKNVLAGPATSHLQGTIRAIMEIKKCSVEQAQEIMERLENRDITIKEFYCQLQEWLGDRWLVDKSPGYSNDLDVLKRAEQYFRDPLYIHLTRHPYGMIRSYVEAKMDLLLGEQLTDLLHLTRREIAEVNWTNSEYNILEFLKQVPRERQLLIKFEDLAAKPEETAEDICRFLHLEFHPGMVQPYRDKKKRMTDGVYSQGQMIGDPKFYQHKSIDAAVADAWREHYQEDFLGQPTWETAGILGYKPIHEDKECTTVPNKDGNTILSFAVSENLWKLNSTAEAQGNIFFIHEITGDAGVYTEFCRHLDHRFNCWGIQADRLKNYTPQNWTMKEIAAKYIQKIKKVQPRGPYYLAGWSFAGNIILEMVLQMEQIGDHLALVAFIDCGGPLSLFRENPGLFIDDIRDFTPGTEKSYIKKFLPGSDIEKKLEEINDIHHLWPLVIDYLESNDLYMEEIKKALEKDQFLAMLALLNYGEPPVENVIHYINLSRTLKNAAAGNIPGGKIRTPLHFFEASQGNRNVPERWNDYCRTPVIYHQLNGDHYSIIQQPRVKELARLFNELLENQMKINN